MEYENKFVGLSSVTSHDLEILRYELEYGWKLALMPNGNNVCAWREWYKGAHISRWLYIDDLLPKEGGEQ